MCSLAVSGILHMATGGLRLGSLAVGVRENEAHAVYNKKIAIMLRLS